MNDIFKYLDELYPNPTCELKFSSNYEFLIAVVLSAQTTDKKVNKVTEELFNRYDINSLSNEELNVIEAILRPLGMSKKKAKYIKTISLDLINKYNYIIPNNINELTKLSGVGRKTANLILSTIYNQPLVAVDTHVSRVTKRLGIAEYKDTPIKVENKLYKVVAKDRLLRTHQQLVLFGRYKCKAINPICIDCKFKNICKYK